MRIDAYNQISQLYKPASKTKVSKPGVVSASDKLEISQFGRELQIAKAAVNSAPDVREDRVAEVKAKYDSGNYDVSAEEFAAKLAEKYNTVF